jgi:hypothetical protein
MSNSNIPGIPGVEAMTGTLDFMKNMWGAGMKLPGMAMPSLSVEEISKQIADLKTVEAWLTLNMNLLRGTIQALEVQSATISALQSMGQTMASMVKPAAPKAEEGSPSASSSSSFSFTPPTAEKPATPEPEQAQAAPQAQIDPASMMAPFANPAAWWNMLQDQFKQAVNTAVAPDENPQAQPAEPVAKEKSAPKARSSTPRKRKAADKS